MGKTVRLADIGERLGVSTVTVSKALSGQKGVSEEMRDRIIALAEELGYRKSTAKSGEQGGYTIGVLISERYLGKYDSFYMNMYQALNAKMAEYNSIAMLITLDGQMEKELSIPKQIQNGMVDGLIITGNQKEGYLEALREATEVPFVLLDFYDDQFGEDAVISDSYYGAYQMTKYLIGKGHKDIAYVGTVQATNSITDRYMGYLRALLEYGIQPNPEWQLDDRIAGSENPEENGLPKLPSHMPTAFFCNCDLTAGRLIKQLEGAGYQVPEDISVAGYDNFLYPGVCEVEITTYEVDIKKMAQRAVGIMLRKLNRKEHTNKLTIVEGRFIEKNSVKDIRER